MAIARRSHIATNGLVIHWAGRYDILAWLLTHGREKAFRNCILDLAGLRGGESILDVGCGTGTLAIAAARRGSSRGGSIAGVDASREMVARARRKATSARLHVTFEQAAAESLPFSDASFDVCFSTLMLHHLPRPVRAQSLREMSRVLKPGGRLVAVDFGHAQRKRGLLARFHRHGHIVPDDVAAMIGDSNLTVTRRGKLGWNDLEFIVATAPAGRAAAEGRIS